MKKKANRLVLTRQLPKTGQNQIYAIEDDGDFQAGWWKGLTVNDNRKRFIRKTIDGDKVVIDLATGLTWAADGDEAGCNDGGQIQWADAITYCRGLNFASFTDWRLPNILELVSIVYFATAHPVVYAPFDNTVSDAYWSSTTYDLVTTTAWKINFNSGAVGTFDKVIDVSYMRAVRGGV